MHEYASATMSCESHLGVLDSSDLLPRILCNLTRRAAFRVSLTCKQFYKAVETLENDHNFSPRVILGCSRQARVVDVSSLLDLPHQHTISKPAVLPTGQSYKKRKWSRGWSDAAKSKKDVNWVTGIAVGPDGDIYA